MYPKQMTAAIAKAIGKNRLNPPRAPVVVSSNPLRIIMSEIWQLFLAVILQSPAGRSYSMRPHSLFLVIRDPSSMCSLKCSFQGSIHCFCSLCGCLLVLMALPLQMSFQLIEMDWPDGPVRVKVSLKQSKALRPQGLAISSGLRGYPPQLFLKGKSLLKMMGLQSSSASSAEMASPLSCSSLQELRYFLWLMQTFSTQQSTQMGAFIGSFTGIVTEHSDDSYFPSTHTLLFAYIALVAYTFSETNSNAIANTVKTIPNTSDIIWASRGVRKKCAFLMKRVSIRNPPLL